MKVTANLIKIWNSGHSLQKEGLFLAETETMRLERAKPGANAIRRKRLWAAVAATVILLAILSMMAVAGYVGWQLTHPEPEPIAAYPADYGLEKLDIEFRSALGGVLLKGWLIPAQDSKKIVIFAHGYGDNRSVVKPTLPLAKALHDQGIASLLFDFRNSGESEKDITSVGQFEKADLLSAIDYAKSLGYEQIGLIGFSMGGATALIAAPETNDVRFVVADSPFADLETYLRDNLSKWSGLPNFPFTPLIMTEIPLVTGIDPSKVRPVEAIRQLRDLPILLVHAENDDLISYENSVILKEASGSAKTELWTTPGDGHIGAYKHDPQQYVKKVTDFAVAHFR